MNLLPVVERELRAEARRPFNFWLRVMGGAAITLAFAGSMLDQSGDPGAIGTRLFGNLNCMLFAGIWVLVPLLTADCISREKREGTLGLLFLTSLTAHGIVVGKSVIHGLRALTLFIGMLPILSLPFLLGGVTWKDGLMASMLDASAVLLALAAGLLASTLAKDWTRALVLALVISFIFAATFMLVHSIGYWALMSQQFNQPGQPRYYGGQNTLTGLVFGWFSHEDILTRLLRLVGLATNLDVGMVWGPRGGTGMGGVWNQTWTSFTPALQHSWLQRTGILAVGSLLLFLLAIQLAALQVRRIWRDKPASAQQLWFLATFCTPRFWRSMFRSKMSRKLQRNPIGWLQQYSWSDRLTKWAWCLLIVVAECLLLSDSQLSLLWRGQYALAPLLLLGLAFTASGSFRSERQTGALELLLVTPLTEGQIIGGRIRGVWSQFFPAGLALAFSWLYLMKDAKVYAGYDYANANAGSFLVFPLFFVSSYCAVPVIGLHFSLQRVNFIAGWLLTFGVGLLLPMMVYGLFVSMIGTATASVYALFAPQLVLGFVALFLLKKTLRRRSFLEKGSF